MISTSSLIVGTPVTADRAPQDWPPEDEAWLPATLVPPNDFLQTGQAFPRIPFAVNTISQ
jgi:hypothetical protein